MERSAWEDQPRNGAPQKDELPGIRNSVPGAMTRQFKIFMLVLGGLHLLGIAYWMLWQLLNADGLVIAGGVHPIGGDFINLWTAGRMVLDGAVSDIYTPGAFSAFQQRFVLTDIGHRVWAYPPHSLFLALPFGAMNYWTGLASWSMLGCAVLVLGARRMQLDWPETLVLLLSPASLMCINFGQSGNLAAGLLMLALTPKSQRDKLAVAATTMLTIKPQLGFMLPVLWALTRRWALIALVSVVLLVVLGLSIAFFGLDSWRGYLFETLPSLKALELYGSGPFDLMVPSLFMAVRILTGDGDLAISAHLVFALALFAVCVWLIRRSPSQTQRQALVLAGMPLITPYLHFYDMSLLLIASYLATRLWSGSGRSSAHILRRYTVLIAWLLPYITILGNGLGVPVSPLLMLGILVVIALAPVEGERN
jgi:hypothetical protein